MPQGLSGSGSVVASRAGLRRTLGQTALCARHRHQACMAGDGGEPCAQNGGDDKGEHPHGASAARQTRPRKLAPRRTGFGRRSPRLPEK
jgi:hypothetical protein